MKVIFPRHYPAFGQPYHHDYLENIFKWLGYEMTYKDDPALIVNVEGQDIFFDHRDASDLISPPRACARQFKFHLCDPNVHNVKAWAPISFTDWDQYWHTFGPDHYDPKPYKLVSCRQRAYGNAATRRESIQRMLKDKLGNQFATGLMPQADYFKDIANIKCIVSVGGYNANILDRNVLQHFGLGVCVISSYLPEVLPFNARIEPGVHYLKCNDDYTDVPDIVRNLDPHAAQRIGWNALTLFRGSCVPQSLKIWLEQDWPR